MKALTLSVSRALCVKRFCRRRRNPEVESTCSPRPAARVRPLSDLHSEFSLRTARRDRFDSGSGLTDQSGKPTDASGSHSCLCNFLFASTSSSL